MTKDFLGSWRVSEYVHNPDGALVGVVQQRRRLEQLANGDVRVWQFCEPCTFAHPVAQRAGEYVFDLRLEGRVRRYLGPDVIGLGLAWGEGAVTGRGLWPRFGYSFTSFSVQTDAARQVTGGRFYEAGAMIANIVGIAEAESDATGRERWPEFEGPPWPGEVSAQWRGMRRTMNAMGKVVAERAVERRYADLSWADAPQAAPVRLEADGRRYRSYFQSYQGLAQRHGWLWEVELFGADGIAIEMTEVLDNTGRQLIGLHRWYTNDSLDRVEVLRLTPTGGKDD